MKSFNTAKKIAPGDIYAVQTGAYAGEMLIYVFAKNNEYCFLSVPIMKNRKVPKIVFEHARNTSIIKYVEKAPEYVVKVAKAQYKQNENVNNRREQSYTSNFLDSESSVKKDANRYT